MNRRQKSPHRRVRSPAYREAFQRLDEALAGERQRNQAEKDQTADAKMTRVRLALFGCAPK